MDVLFTGLRATLEVLLQLLKHPVYFIGILFVMLQYHRQIELERKLFHVKLHSILNETGRTMLWGLVGGFAVSFVMAFVGVSFRAETVLLLWAVSILLMLMRLRFFCFAYAVGLVGIVHAVVLLFPDFPEYQAIGWLIQPIIEFHVPSLLGLVGILHVLEAVLVRLQGPKTARPLIVAGKRGKLVGSFSMNSLWPIPLFLVVPLQAGSGGMGFSLPWIPLLSGDYGHAAWTILAFPVVIGFAEMTTSRLPQHKVQRSSSLLLLYAVIVFGLAVCTNYWPVLTIGACLITVLLHEVLIWYSRWDESQRSPLYVHDEQGLMILSVVPGSPAAQMGIQVGEVLHRVNGMKVQTPRDLYEALQINSAFCKLEVINLQGHSKFVNRAIFADEHHQLGIILAPSQDSNVYVEEKRKQSGLFSICISHKKEL